MSNVPNFVAPEHLTEMNKVAVDTALHLAKISFESAERLFSLQLEASKESFAEATKTAKAAVEAKDPQALMDLRSKLTEGSVEKAIEYSRSLYEVATHTQAQLSALLEERLAEWNKTVATSIDKAVKSAPAGADVAIAAVKSTVAATAAAIDGMTKAAKQVANFTDASVKATGNVAAAAAKSTTRAK